MNNKKGSLTIEASIALTAFMFIVVTILSFSTIYKAQGIVGHATLQTSQSLAIDTYYRETMSAPGATGSTAYSISMLIKFAGLLGFDNTASWDDGYASLGDSGTDFYKIAKEAFAYSIADDVDSADEILEDVGIVDGLDGLDFTYSSVTDGNIIINVQYKVKLPFSFFGEHTMALSKSAKTKAFKSISGTNGYVVT